MAENAGTKWRQWVNLEEMGAGVAWEGFPTTNRSRFHKECLAGSQMEDRQQEQQQARIELATVPCRIWFPVLSAGSQALPTGRQTGTL